MQTFQILMWNYSNRSRPTTSSYTEANENRKTNKMYASMRKMSESRVCIKPNEKLANDHLHIFVRWIFGGAAAIADCGAKHSGRCSE